MIKLVQCLCSEQRHCIAALGYNNDDLSDKEAIEGLHEAILMALDGEGVEQLGFPKKLNPWCGICGARQSSWRYEIGIVKAGTMREAERLLKRGEIEQSSGRAVLDALGLSYDAWKKKHTN